MSRSPPRAGQHDNGHLAAAPQPPAHLQVVQPWQHHVQNDNIGCGAADRAPPRRSRRSARHSQDGAAPSSRPSPAAGSSSTSRTVVIICMARMPPRPQHSPGDGLTTGQNAWKPAHKAISAPRMPPAVRHRCHDPVRGSSQRRHEHPRNRHPRSAVLLRIPGRSLAPQDSDQTTHRSSRAGPSIRCRGRNITGTRNHGSSGRKRF